MQLSKLFLAVFAFIAVAVALPVSTSQSGGLARRSSDLASRSNSFALDESTSLLARTFGEDDDGYLQARDDCVVCLEANAKSTNCPNGHPGHMQCLMQWMNAQAAAGHPLTCPACRAKASNLIKPIKKGKRDLEEVEEMPEARSFDEEESSGLESRDDCVVCLEANAKSTNCPNGHPGHMQCLMQWMNAQAAAGHPLTCPACRAKASNLIKPIKKGKRDLEEVEEMPEARSFDDEESSGLQSRDDCVVCLEANAKSTNCPNGHPGHMQCLMQWMNAQAAAGHPLTCPACRAKASNLIKPVKKGKRDLSGLKAEVKIREVDEESYPSSLLRRDDQCAVCLEANAKHSNCPNGASHPAHIACLMQWAQSQASAGQPLTCAACRTKVSPLIKKVKQREFDEEVLEMRDADEEELEMRDVDEEESYPSSLLRRDDQCAVCLEANAKHSNCPNGASHPAHIQCLMQWAQSQASAGQPLTCAACRSKISPLIKKVKQ
ncbi:hypothetical protein CALVIDRAFT_563327 [Calocera viscosa TUFC12733]|uniref:RING-type domain-containing protein n=1 Tax=Calocera viscosa (strain TUFC12733) TaxID=1330018 RepID=A0A167MW24_CALVF|nr:hypothetical protein CALVIDRAFT_563327 [Calocera viscosa TUFC12733]